MTDIYLPKKGPPHRFRKFLLRQIILMYPNLTVLVIEHRAKKARRRADGR